MLHRTGVHRKSHTHVHGKNNSIHSSVDALVHMKECGIGEAGEVGISSNSNTNINISIIPRPSTLPCT